MRQVALDDGTGNVVRYHPRSDAHSRALCNLIAQYLVDRSQTLAEQVARSEVSFHTNYRYRWPGSLNSKAIDLALVDLHGEVRVACECKSTMTEHLKSLPRLFDELASSAQIVNRGNPVAVAAAVEVVNAAPRFLSPLRSPNAWTTHRQPDVAKRVVDHLRALPRRAGVEEGEGLDAFCTIVIDCDNVGLARLVTDGPAPADSDADSYESFLHDVVQAYEHRFSKVLTRFEAGVGHGVRVRPVDAP